jgi:hypothetical protein
MKAHLVRHLNAGHGVGGGRPAGAQKSSGAKRGRPAKAVSMGSFDPDIGRAVSELQSLHGGLLAQRETIDSRIDAVANALAQLGAGAAVAARPRVNKPAVKKLGRPAGSASRVKLGGGRREAGNSLREYIVRALKASTSPMSVKDISTQVVKIGYQTSSKDLSKAVSNMLPQMKNQVKKVDRGTYRI